MVFKFVTPGSAPPKKPTFQSICHEMYKNFGGAYRNLQALVKCEADRELLNAQLHELRDSVREQFDKIKGLEE